MPAPQAWGDPDRGEVRGRGMAGASIYFSVFGAPTSRLLVVLLNRNLADSAMAVRLPRMIMHANMHSMTLTQSQILMNMIILETRGEQG